MAPLARERDDRSDTNISETNTLMAPPVQAPDDCSDTNNLEANNLPA
jgi:hypothetical protein